MAKDHQPVFKVLTETQWQQFKNDGVFYGSEHDLRDGFFHLATLGQLDYVIKKYFKNLWPLYVIEFCQEAFLSKLVFEPNSHGDLFPHLYEEPLKLEHMSSHRVIEADE